VHHDVRRYDIINAGHEKDISKVVFNPQGTKILTAGYDQIARLWDSETGELLQKLEGHTD
jgi:dynein assembly factor with WDR repeat domains 1